MHVAAPLLLAALALTAGCARSDGVAGSDTSDTGPAGLRAVIAALCAARDAALGGDSARARTIFFDDAHYRLHELAEAASGDRRAVARLLEAKQRVEDDLTTATIGSGDDLSEDLADLAVASADAAEVTGEPRPAPCAA